MAMVTQFKDFSSRTILYSIWSTVGFLVLVQSQYMIDKTKVLEDTMLYGYSYRTLTMKTVDECFLHCYEDCFCMTFQMCKNTECHLLLSNRFQSPSALSTTSGCSYYDMLPDLNHEVKKTGCSNPGSVCTFYGHSCKNGQHYVALTPKDVTAPRYKCQCPTGYTGYLCQSQVKSCRAYSNGSRVPGKYQVFDENMDLFEVFCDFDSDSKMTWTLIQSYQRQNAKVFNKPYSQDWPRNEDTPRWDEYRLSKSLMQSIQNDSSKFRVTCKYDTDGVVYTDYLQATKAEIDILTLHNAGVNPQCSYVEYINIRGQYCSNCTALIHQTSYTLHVHNVNPNFPVTSSCVFQPTSKSRCSHSAEVLSFGAYNCYTINHRCSSAKEATTQTWLGNN